MTFLVAALPVIELRGAIPLGVAQGLSPLYAFLAAYAGSMLPVPILLLLIRPVFKMLAHTRTGAKIVNRLSIRSIAHSKGVKKYGFAGLVLFVAIPFPGTGVWSGALAAVLLDIRFRRAFPAIALGNLIAGVIVMALSYGVSAFLL
ncbi:MAG: small multi-drug export protein [Bacillota bacterium]|nr:small multi-drug export protein [Bacillota bacterium]